MTHEILQTDIDLARSLLESGRQDAEIISTLGSRGIPLSKAARVVTDLRHGRKVEPDNSSEELGIRNPMERYGAAAVQSANVSGGNAAVQSTVKSRDSRPSQNNANRSKPWFAILLFISLVACLAAIVFINHRAHAKLEASTLESPRLDLKKASSDPALWGKALLEVTPEGLLFRGHLVTRSNTLQTLIESLGAPNRTNVVEGFDKNMPDKTVYAFDNEGLLVYSGRTGRDDCVVLDFEAMGGAAGAQKPFTGTLKVEELLIQGNTSPQSLAAVKGLGLDDPAKSTGVLGAHYKDLGLIFSYLKSSEHLSLVEIDLK